MQLRRTGMDNDWELVIHASSTPPECLPGLLPWTQPKVAFHGGLAANSRSSAVFMDPSPSQSGEGPHRSRLWWPVWPSSAGWWLYLRVEIVCCCEHSNPILQCYVTLWKCRLKHTDSSILQGDFFSREKNLDWIFPFFCLLSLPYFVNMTVSFFMNLSSQSLAKHRMTFCKDV